LERLLSLLTNTSIFLAMLSLIVGLITYFYKVWRESTKNKKLALYYLFEAWFRLSILYKKTYDTEFDKLRNSLDTNYPHTRISDNEFENQKKSWSKVIFQQSVSSSLSDFDMTAQALESAIKAIALDDPILAFQLNTSQDVNKVQDYLSGYSATIQENAAIKELIEKNIIDQNLLAETLSHAQNTHLIEILKQLESNIIFLSRKISFYCYKKSKKTIEKRKENIGEVNETSLIHAKEISTKLMTEIEKSQKII